MTGPGTIIITRDALPPGFAHKVDELVEERGGKPLSFDELCDLRKAFDRVRQSEVWEEDETDQRGLIWRTLAAGDALLRSQTLAVEIKFAEIQTWTIPVQFSGDPSLWIEAMQAYCLAHSDDREALAMLVNPVQATVALLHWAPCLTCTREQLRSAIAELTAGANPPPMTAQKKKAQTTPFCSWFLQTAQGGQPTTGSMPSPPAMHHGRSGQSTARQPGKPEPATGPRPRTTRVSPLPNTGSQQSDGCLR